jgi:DNA-binding transcriptional LysR family regulator
VVGTELEHVPILHERLVAAVGEGSAWRERKGLLSLAREPFVVCSRAVSASYYDHVVACCHTAGFAPRIVTETNDLFSLLQLVRAGVGVALAPTAVAAMRVPGVRLKEVRLAQAAWDIALVWRRQRERAALVEAFVRVARQVYEERGRR